MPKRTFVVSFRRRLVERREPERRQVHVERETIGDAITSHPSEDRSIVIRAGVSFENSLLVLFPEGVYERFDPEANAVYLSDQWSLEVGEEVVLFRHGSRGDLKTPWFTLCVRDVRAIRIEYKEEN